MWSKLAENMLAISRNSLEKQTGPLSSSVLKLVPVAGYQVSRRRDTVKTI